MLLRRVIKHVRGQEWTAIVIDFFIVVFGVFVGLQVQQWANEQETRKREGVYVERLHGEIVILIEQRRENLEGRITNKAALLSAHIKLFGDDDEFEFTPEECRALSVITIMTDLTIDLPVLTELLSAGELNTIRSTELRTSLVHFVQFTARAEDALDGINRGAINLQEKYPEFISVRVDLELLSNSEYRFQAACKTQGMRKNVAFLNDFAEGHLRFGSYVDGVVLSGSERLTELHTLLDSELSITHAEETK